MYLLLAGYTSKINTDGDAGGDRDCGGKGYILDQVYRFIWSRLLFKDMMGYKGPGIVVTGLLLH